MSDLSVCDGIWGRAEIVRALPGLSLVEDVLFIPWLPGRAAWGLFNADGSPVTQAVNTRGPDYRLSGPRMSFCAEAASSAAVHDIETWMYGGLLMRHFGHFIVNSLPRFWPALQSACPPLLCHFEGDVSSFRDGFAGQLLAPLGIDLSALKTPDCPVRVRRVYVPNPALVEQMAAHHILAIMGDRIGQAFEPSDRKDLNIVYLSKTKLRSGVGQFVGEHVIEEAMRALGAAIIYPEEETITSQIGILKRAELVVGTVGSAFHTCLFGQKGSRIVGLNPIREVNSNFLLLDRLTGTQSLYLYAAGTRSEGGGEFLTAHSLFDPVAVAQCLVERVKEAL